MSSIVYLKNKSNGTVYAYLNESEWDPVAKKCRCKRKCLGHVDPDTGDIVPNRGHGEKAAATVRSTGTYRFLDHIVKGIGLKDALKSSMPDKAPMILSCVYCILAQGKVLTAIPYWSEDNDTPYGKKITTAAVSEVLSDISENDLFAFFRAWRDRSEDRSFYAISTSSMSSFDSRSEMIRFNDLPDLDLDTKTHMYLVMGSESRRPVAYGYYPSAPKSLTDLRKRMNDMLWLDVPDPVHIVDSEYCTEDNFDDFLRSNQKFVMRAPPDFPFALESIRRVKGRIMDTKNMITVDGTMVFAMSFINYRNGKKCFAHIIFSAEEAEQEFSVFLSLIEQCYRELLTGVYVKEHKEYYEKYFITRDSEYGSYVEENGEAIMTYNDVAGFMVLLTNSVKNPEEAYRHYLQKDRIQEYFEDMRNRSDRSELKLYSDDVYKGRIFIQFLVTVVFAEIRRRMSTLTLLKSLSFRDIIHEMSTVKRISIPGFDTPFYTNLDNTQMRIIKAFDMDPTAFHK